MGKEIRHIVFLRNPDEAPAWGGLEKLMMDWFERIDYRFVSVTLAVSKSWVDTFAGKIKAINKPVSVIELPWEPGRVGFLKRFGDMRRFLKGLQPSTIIYIQGWAFSFDLASVMAGFFSAKEVYMHENLGSPAPLPKTSKQYLGFIPGLGLWWFAAKFSVMLRAYFSRKIIAVSRGVQENLIKFWNYPEEKVVVRYHGVNLNHFRPSAEARSKMRKALRIPESEKVIIAASHLTKVKRLDRLIEVFELLCKESSGLTLLIGGTGPLEAELKALAKSKACASKIVFLGYVDNVNEYLKMSDVYVLASDNEGFSIALLEAMATGLICVSTDCPGSSEIIQDGINGFLVEKSTEGLREGLKKALELSAQKQSEISKRAVSLVTENFELNKRIRAVFDAFGLAYSSSGRVSV